MAFFAKRQSDGRIIKPSQAEKSDPLVCRGCGDGMALYDSFEDKNGRFVSSHFKHKSESCGYGGAGSGGESDRHEEMKEIALHKLQWDFDLAHSTLEQTVGENIADVYGRFESPEWPYGYGIVVEAQYKNEDKDIEAVTQNYLEHGYSVCWVYEDQYDGRDVDLLEGRVNTVWPEAVPSMVEWNHDSQHSREPIGPSYPPETNVPARLPDEWFHEQSRRMWHETDWEDIFPNPHGYEADSFILEVRNTLRNPDETEINLAPDIVAQLEFDRLKDEFSAESIGELQRIIWGGFPWDIRFTGDANEHFPRPQPKPTGTFHLPKWLGDDGRVVHEWDNRRGSFGIRYRDAESSTPAPPAKNYLIPESLLGDLISGLDIKMQYPEIDETIEKIVRIVDYNTDNTIQPETAPISSIRQIAHHANVPSGESRAAIEQAIEMGKLIENDGRVRLAEE